MYHLGKYQLVAELARGGMGIVYLAISEGPGGFSKLLIVKELKPDLVSDPSFLQMFLEEARLAARLSHSNIIQTYEVGADEGRHYIVMEYLDGVTLSRVVRKKSPDFSLDMQVRVICEMLKGLHYAHTLKDFDGAPLGIVHRDVSPQNVFISFDGQVKIGDFGIAKARDSSIETNAGVLKGKPAYMAPEQVAGRADARSDVYSAGVMLWEAVARRRMWAGAGELEILSNVIAGTVPSLQEVAPDAPPELVAIIMRALAKDPDQRYPSADALLVDLDGYLAPRNVTTRAVSEVVEPLFNEERAKKRSVIEAHIASARGGRSERVSALPAMPESTTTPAADGSVAPTPSRPPGSLPPVAATRNQRRTAIVASTLLALAGIGASIAVWLGAERAEPRGVATRAPAPSAAADVRPGAAESAPAAEPATPPTTSPARGEVATAAPSAAVASPIDSAPPAVKAAQPLRANNRAQTTPPLPRTTPPPPRTTAARPAPTPSATSAEEKSGTGYLTLDTYPWTRVSLGGRVLGDTPLVRAPLPAGTHTLVLENSGEKIRQTTVVTIKPGETVSRRLAF